MDSLNLNWKAFPEHLKLISRELYEEDRYSDITLISDDQFQFKAHKIILSACSPVFRNIIDYNPTQNSLIYLRGVQSQELEPILQFMYLGEGNLSYERMGVFLKVAKDLQVKEININEELETEEDNFDNKRETIQDMREDENTGDDTNLRKLLHEEIRFVSDHEATEQSDSPVEDDEPSYFQRQLGTQLELKFPALNEERKMFHCAECDYQTTNKYNIKKHTEGQHEGIKYPCTECPYTASQTVNLRKHLLTKHDVARYNCTQCKYQATEETLLEKHTKKKHSNRRKGDYSCDSCDYKGGAASSLWYHMKFKH